MIPQIYGNDTVLELIRTMRVRGRIPHAALIYGEKGMGRKTIARYFAMTALCTGDAAPCGECPSCRKLLLDDLDTVHPHPDVMWVEHSGKKGGFSVETVRRICKDAIVAPNDGQRKVYIFADCDHMDIRAQNTLLKLTEEPPLHVLLLFTAEHQNAFLETMRSRMTPIAVRPCTPADCRTALIQQHGHTAVDAGRAVTACGSNIGAALCWLESDAMQEMTRQITAVIQAVISHQPYEVLRIFSKYENDRTGAAELLRQLDRQVGNALALSFGKPENALSFLPGTPELARRITPGRARRMHDHLQSAYEALQANVSAKVVLAALGGLLFL